MGQARTCRHCGTLVNGQYYHIQINGVPCFFHKTLLPQDKDCLSYFVNANRSRIQQYRPLPPIA